MSSFFAGVKSWLFGESSTGQTHQQNGSSGSEDEYVQHAGQKRSREQHRRLREPVLQEVSLLRPAGVQGFDWFTNSLKLDADGDAAHDFLVEDQQQQPSTTAAAAAHVQGPSQAAQPSSAPSSQQQQAAQQHQQQHQPQQQCFHLRGAQKGNLVVTHS